MIRAECTHPETITKKGKWGNENEASDHLGERSPQQAPRDKSPRFSPTSLNEKKKNQSGGQLEKKKSPTLTHLPSFNPLLFPARLQDLTASHSRHALSMKPQKMVRRRNQLFRPPRALKMHRLVLWRRSMAEKSQVLSVTQAKKKKKSHTPSPQNGLRAQTPHTWMMKMHEWPSAGKTNT